MKTATHLDIEAENEPYYRVIVLKGRLDLVTVFRFANFVRHEIIGGARQVMIDCSALEHISSAGIGGLVAPGKALAEHSGN